VPECGNRVQKASPSHDIEILVALPDGKGGIRSQEFVPQDLGQEDVVGHVLGFKLVAADGSVGEAQVARFPPDLPDDVLPNKFVSVLIKSIRPSRM
jgi:hypothetical protein